MPQSAVHFEDGRGVSVHSWSTGPRRTVRPGAARFPETAARWCRGAVGSGSSNESSPGLGGAAGPRHPPFGQTQSSLRSSRLGMTKTKIQNIQALRGLAILLVLARHLLVMEGKYFGGKTLLPQILKVGDSGVDLFFLISGFIMVVVSSGQFHKPGTFGTFLYKRAARIFPLYWLFSLIIAVVFVVAPAAVPALQRGQVNVVASILLLPQFFPPLLGQGWSLVHEAYFYLVFALALWLPERRLCFFLILWGLAVAIGYNLCVPSPALFENPTLKVVTNPLTIEFVLGACVALALRLGWRRGDWWCLIGGCLLLPMSSLFFDPLDIHGLRLFCFGLPAMLILFGAVSLESRSRFHFPRWMQSIGDASFSIYLSHILVISAVGQLWGKHRHFETVYHALGILTMLAAAVGCGFAIYHWIEQPMLRASHTWLARRRKPVAVVPEMSTVHE
jgi:exopolysaccharide production protein ExoZ